MASPGYFLQSVLPSSWRYSECAHFEECMIASAEAQELEEVLARVEASVHDLIGAEEAKAMARKT